MFLLIAAFESFRGTIGVREIYIASMTDARRKLVTQDGIVVPYYSTDIGISIAAWSINSVTSVY
jgi:hypothetical protein